LLSKKFLLLNGLAIINVVINHSIGWTFVAIFWWVHRDTSLTSPDFSQLYSPSYYVLRILEQLIIPSIPAFLLVSGFFAAFSGGKKRAIEWNYVISRIRYLLIPYLIWSTIMVIFNVLQNTSYTPPQLLRLYLTGQAAEAYYFVPLLITFYLLSPIFIRLVNWNWKSFLLIVASLQIVTKLGDYPIILGITTPLTPLFSFLNSGWFFIGHIFWFSFGMVIGIYHSEIKEYFFRTRWILLVLSVFLFIAGIIEWEWLLIQSNEAWIGPHETLIDNFYSVAILSAYIGFLNVRFPFSKKLEELGPKSFGIFLAHSLFLTIAARGIYHFLPQLLGLPLVFFVVLVIIGLSMPLILMNITHKSFLRPISTYLFG
jgi:fucose 4-O-acetylase-like acetyltransferase